MYLSPDDELAFLDFEKRKPEYNFTKECNVCKGHGGWNLRLFAYTLPHMMEDNSENRHKYVHFKAGCQNCNGWGYVEESHNCIGHNFHKVETISNCLHLYSCLHCGQTTEIDSSD